eukprot:2912547-Amphidinium_carterae.1
MDSKTLPPEAPPQGEDPERATLPRCIMEVCSSGQAYENQGHRGIQGQARNPQWKVNNHQQEAHKSQKVTRNNIIVHPG